MEYKSTQLEEEYGSPIGHILLIHRNFTMTYPYSATYTTMSTTSTAMSQRTEVYPDHSLQNSNGGRRFMPILSMGKSLPIACPSPSLDSIREKEVEEDMISMYNTKTWKMYHLIIRARNKMKQDSPEASTKMRDKVSLPTSLHHQVPDVVYTTASLSDHFYTNDESSSHDEFQIFDMDDY